MQKKNRDICYSTVNRKNRPTEDMNNKLQILRRKKDKIKSFSRYQ